MPKQSGETAKFSVPENCARVGQAVFSLIVTEINVESGFRYGASFSWFINPNPCSCPAMAQFFVCAEFRCFTSRRDTGTSRQTNPKYCTCNPHENCCPSSTILPGLLSCDLAAACNHKNHTLTFFQSLYFTLRLSPKVITFIIFHARRLYNVSLVDGVAQLLTRTF